VPPRQKFPLLPSLDSLATLQHTNPSCIVVTWVVAGLFFISTMVTTCSNIIMLRNNIRNSENKK
jgi:hypothetical protein